MFVSNQLIQRIQEKFYPAHLRKQLSLAAKKSGFTKPVFLLSFDCDTYKDAQVVGDVHDKLTEVGITPIYAVPCEILMKDSGAYQDIAKSGAEFINHGYYEHSRLHEDGKTYESWNFYDKISAKEMEEDVLRGHDFLSQFLGREPKGFRTPHFGSFQKKTDLERLYKILLKKNYEFSTSTVPAKAIQHSALYKVNGLVEIPVGGGYDFPLTILDSYSFRYSESFKFGEADYLLQIRKLANWFEKTGSPYVLNLYADPSQVYDWPAFFSAMAQLAQFNVNSYEKLIKIAESNE